MLTTDKPISTTQVTRVSDMRTLPKLDDDAILLVVSNGACWKMPVKHLRNKTLNDVLEEVQKVTDHMQDQVAISISSLNSKILKAEDIANDANLKNKIIKEKLSIEILPTIEANKKNIYSLLSTCKDLNKDISTKYSQLSLAIVNLDIKTLREKIRSSLKNIDNLSANYIDTTSTLQSNIHSIECSCSNLSDKLSQTDDTFLEKIHILENNINSISTTYTTKIDVEDLAIKNISVDVDKQLTIINALDLKLLEYKMANSTYIEQLNSINDLYMKIDKKITDLDAKLFGIEVLQEDEHGNIKNETIQQGEIFLLNLRILLLENSFNSAKNKQSRKDIKEVKDKE